MALFHIQPTIDSVRLLKHARMEWAVEAMHWMLDVHFGGDFYRTLGKGGQQNLNVVHATVLNHLRRDRELTGSKRPFSNIMLDCLIDCDKLIPLFFDSRGPFYVDLSLQVLISIPN